MLCMQWRGGAGLRKRHCDDAEETEHQYTRGKVLGNRTTVRHVWATHLKDGSGRGIHSESA
jgi:hypothetical protein